MKKILFLSAFAAVLFSVLFYVPKAVRTSVTSSGAVKLSYDLYTEQISANGEVENQGEYCVSSPVPVIISEFCVKEGDSVSAGDTVAIIDVDATKNYLTTLASQSAYSSLIGVQATAFLNSVPSKLYSAKTGIVAQINGTEGEAVNMDTPVMKIINNDTLLAVVSVNEAEVNKIEIGQSAYVTCKALNENSYHGMVSAISPVARKRYVGTSSETVVDVSITLDDTAMLKSGYTVSADIDVSDGEVVCFLPYETIMQDDGGSYVYVYADGKRIRKDIVTGRDLPKGEEILSGLTDDDIVLTNTTIDSKEAVKIKYGID